MFLPLVVVCVAAPVNIEIYVPLCDGAALACGSKSAGDPTSLEANLYWGAMYGAERFLSKYEGIRVESRRDAPSADQPWILRELVLVRKPEAHEREVRVRLLAYDGRYIDHALVDFLAAAAGKSSADALVWAGHDRLMDVPAPPVTQTGTPRPVIVLACESEQYFGPVLARLGAPALALTRTFMAPEAYLHVAVLAQAAKNGLSDKAALRQALIAAYAQYQKISAKSAGSVFSRL